MAKPWILNSEENRIFFDIQNVGNLYWTWSTVAQCLSLLYFSRALKLEIFSDVVTVVYTYSMTQSTRGIKMSSFLLIFFLTVYRMLGRLVVKLFWWLLSRGWLPDSLLRKWDCLLLLFSFKYFLYERSPLNAGRLNGGLIPFLLNRWRIR